MHKFAQSLLAFVFMNGLALFIVCLSVQTSGFSVATIKQELSKSTVYPIVAKLSIDNLEQQLKNDRTLDDGTRLAVMGIIQSRLTPAYFQTKIDRFIDQTAEYVKGTATIAPTITFNDLRDEILNGAVPPQGTTDTTIHVDKQLNTLRSLYSWYMPAYILSGILTVISFILIIWMSPTLISRLKAVGHLLLSTAVFVFLPFYIISQSIDSMWTILTRKYPQYIDLIRPIYDAIFAPVINEFFRLQNITMVICFVIATICYIYAYILHRQEKRDDEAKHEAVQQAELKSLTAPPPSLQPVKRA